MNKSDFSGFSLECLQFFDDLKKNNNRDWFQEHKQHYTDYVQAPAKEFVITFGERLKSISPGISYDTRMSGAGSVLRVYRDIRFSKDKSPYNTRLRIFFGEGSKKKMENPGFFFGLDERGARIYTGMYKFPKPVLTSYRDAVIDSQLGGELTTIIKTLRNSGMYEVGGTHYKRVPRGYDKEHQHADLLKYNGVFTSSPLIEPGIVTSSNFLDICFEHCLKMAPLHRWLVKITKNESEGL